MAKRLQIVLMVFCLGVFIFPKQMVPAENTEMPCCKTEKTTKNCCGKSEKSAPCHDSKKQSHSCDSNCNNCSSCSFTVVFIGVNVSLDEFKIPQKISNKVETFYLQPNFSTLSKAIWQPPKIG